jgi:hypothetical protein
MVELVQPELPEQLALKVTQDQRVHAEKQVRREPKATLDQRVQLALKVTPVIAVR